MSVALARIRGSVGASFGVKRGDGLSIRGVGNAQLQIVEVCKREPWGAMTACTPTSTRSLVVVTGASSGIGFELAKQFAAHDSAKAAMHRKIAAPGSGRK